MRYKTLEVISLFVLSVLLISCDPEVIEDPFIDDTQIVTGNVEVDFVIRHPWIPVKRIVRTGLHFALSNDQINHGDYFLSFNVSDTRRYYRVDLSPGTYYYEAIIACICEGDSCSGGGFPGNKFGTKHTMGRFTIYEDETTVVIPSFN